MEFADVGAGGRGYEKQNCPNTSKIPENMYAGKVQLQLNDQ